MSLYIDEVECIDDNASSKIYDTDEIESGKKVDLETSETEEADENSFDNMLSVQDGTMVDDGAIVIQLICYHCEKTFTSESEYGKHVATHRLEDNEEHEDPHREASEAMRYNQSNSTKAMSSCNICGKVFSQHGNLKIHMRIHSKERPFACTTCGKSFTQLGNLQTHMHIHLGSKPFVCDICLRGFTQAGNVKKHRETVHEGKPPLRCDICEEVYETPTKLSIHARVHVLDYDNSTPSKSSKTKPTADQVKTGASTPIGEVTRGCDNAEGSDGADAADSTAVSPVKRTAIAFDPSKFDIDSCKRLRLAVYYCTLCKKTFDSDSELTHHLSSHK